VIESKTSFYSVAKSVLTKTNNTDPFFLSEEYAITRANLSFFSPSLLKDSKEIYRSIKKQKELKDSFGLVNLDQPYLIKGGYNFSGRLGSGPFIFASFHMGPVGPLLSMLSNLQISFSLLTDDYSFKKYAERDQLTYLNYTESKKLYHDFEVLNVEDKRIGLQISRALREGKSIVLYIDGNSGIGGIERFDDKFDKVKFLGKEIIVRKGAASFSSKLNIPIVPVVSYLEQDEKGLHSVLEFCETIFPDSTLPKALYVNTTNQKIYSLLEGFVLKYPNQWEGWLYFDSFILKHQTPKHEIQSQG
jgi:hypothetical protein